MNAKTKILAAVGVASGLFFCGAAIAASKIKVNVKEVMRSSFKDKGQATLDRLNQDETQALCTKFATGQVAADALTKVIATNQATLVYPSDGGYLGDWKRGEQIAQTGVGKQYSDDATKPSGGNCYACHRLGTAELAYGTLGPSLNGYGKQRGMLEPMLKYTWGKIYNTKAYMPCSNMPRFGHQSILTEEQMKDVMALLFDPASPVNQ